MNGDPRLKPFSYFKKESEFERQQFLEQYKAEREYFQHKEQQLEQPKNEQRTKKPQQRLT